MKKFQMAFFSGALLLSLSACNMANEDDYANMAVDICDCANKNSANLSQAMKDVIINSNGDTTKFNAGIMEYTMNDTEGAMKDMTAMASFGEEFGKCAESLEKKYDNIYTKDDDKVVEQKLVAALEKNKDCKFTYALMKIGLQEEE